MEGYKALSVQTALRDGVIDERVLVELKAVETVLPVHKANFNVAVLKDGIRRLVWTPKTEQ